MDIPAALIDFISERNEIKEQINALIDANEEVYSMDLEQLQEDNSELSTRLQQNFGKNYEKIRELFRAHTLANHGRELDIVFFNPALRLKLRDLKSSVLGSLVSFLGTATRSSQVRPELTTASFLCSDCKTQIPGIKQEFIFTEPLFCPNHLCTNRTRYELDLPKCIFSNWQRIHVQESTLEIPRGSLPRSVDVVSRDSLVEKIKPGTHVVLTGYCVAVPTGQSIASSKCAAAVDGIADQKPKRRQHELSHNLVFICVHFSENSSAFLKNLLNWNINFVADGAEDAPQVTMDQLAIIKRMQESPHLYETLAESLFPTIHGHNSIKCSILLMLVGGVTKKRDIRLRGDINILLVGDPGTAKSQFLKQTSTIFPCSVYTSGKSSSSAGLTAAVVRDGESGDFTIEAGALMLSDGGICCIDEFDKMTYKDQVSIHEAMEQQTITIAKAGINATLNSRASILAAANPVRGRYDSRKTLRQNVNLSPPIMSRFDLYFVLIDEPNPDSDRKVALKMLDNHQKYNSAYQSAYTSFSENPSNLYNSSKVGSLSACDPLFNVGFTIDEVLLYVTYVKHLKPTMSDDAIELLTAKYRELRQDSAVNPTNYKMTARHLESLVRLSEALAKIHNDRIVGPAYVMEAYRLIKSSVIELSSEEISLVCKTSDEEYLIKDKEYLKITNGLIYILKAEQMGRDELCARYLEMIEESIENEARLEHEREKCMRVIVFLMESEGVLFEVDGMLHIHPNYDN